MPHEVGYAYVGYEEAFPASEPPTDGIAFYFSRIPKSWLVETVCKLGTTLFNMQSYMLNVNQQIAFVESLRRDVSYHERLARFLATHPTRVFVHTNLVTALMRQVLLHGGTDGNVPAYAYDHLLRSIALFNSAYGRKRLVGDRGRDAFLPYELENMMEMKFNFSFALARYYKLMEWSRAQSPASKYYMPLHDDFAAFFAGAGYEEYAAAAFVIANPFTVQLDLGRWREQRGSVDMSQWVAPLHTTTPIAAQLRTLAIDGTWRRELVVGARRPLRARRPTTVHGSAATASRR